MTHEIFIIVLGAFLVAELCFVIYGLKKYKTLFKNCVDAATNLGKRKILNDWSLLSNGSSGDPELEIAWLRLANTTYKLFCKKHHDYGKNNLAGTGLFGIIVRMGDKVSRLWTLSQNRNKPKVFETQKDTVLDLLNYCFMALMILNGDIKETTLSKTIGSDAKIRVLIGEYAEMTDKEKERFVSAMMASDIASDLKAELKIFDDD